MLQAHQNLDISKVLKDILLHTANLNQLTKELYTAPKEAYNCFGYNKVEEFSQCSDLKIILLKIISQYYVRQLKINPLW